MQNELEKPLQHYRRYISQRVFLWLALPVLIWNCNRAGQPSSRLNEAADLPREDIYVYRQVPDIAITTSAGTQPLSVMLEEGPVLFTMVYTRCTGVCYPFTHSLKNALQAIGALPQGGRVVVISFDPRDSLKTMHWMAAALGLEKNPAWIFGTASPSDIDRMANSIGYWRRWDASLQQYDHPAVLIGLRKDRRIARFLVGATVSPVRLQEVLRELCGEFVRAYPLPAKNIVFRCFQYDPTKGLQLNWGFLLLLLPGIATFGSTGWVFWRGRRVRRRGSNGSHTL